jgi:outer membrane immunogenic protein
MRQQTSFLTIAASIAAIALGSAAASAADLAPRYTKAPPPVAAFSWTGFYIGGFVGGAFADGNAMSTEPRTAAGVFYNGPLTNNYSLSNSVIAGGTIGYNWQPAASNWVIGIEGEAGYIHLNRTIQDINAINNGLAFPDSLDSTRIGDWYGVIAGRAGFTFNQALFYAKGGAAFVNKNYSFADNCTAAPCGPGILNLSNNRTQVTWAAGAGIEYALTNNWSIKGEYLYLGTRETVASTGVGGGTAAGLVFSNSHTDPGVHTAKFGVNYRFGAGPLVAKY